MIWWLVACSAPKPEVPTARHAEALDVAAVSDAAGLPLLTLTDKGLTWRGRSVDDLAPVVADETAEDLLVAVDAGRPWSEVAPLFEAMAGRYERLGFVVAGTPDPLPTASGTAESVVRRVDDRFVFRPERNQPLFTGTDVRLMGAIAGKGGVFAAGGGRAAGDVLGTLDLLHGAGSRCWWLGNDPRDGATTTATGRVTTPEAVLWVPLDPSVGDCTLTAGPPVGDRVAPPPSEGWVQDITGSLTTSAILGALDLDALAACGPISARLDIGTDGRLAGSIIGSSVDDDRDAVEQCAARVVEAARFPTADLPSRVALVTPSP